VSRDGSSYTGFNDAHFYDLDGNMFAEAAGTAVARRISPPTLFCLKDVLTERSHHSPMAPDKRGELDAECGAGVT